MRANAKKALALLVVLAMLATSMVVVFAQVDESALLIDFDLSNPYVNGPNGTVTKGSVLHMVKDQAGSNFNVILWSDAVDGKTDTMTLNFDAKVKGGAGHSWDGYAVSLRTTSGGDVELVRLVPTATGVDITKNAGAATIGKIDGTDYHAYSVVYSKADDTLTVYADGTKVIDNVALEWGGNSQHGFLIKSGHNDATGVELDIMNVKLYEGEQVNEVVGEAPSEDATEVPSEETTKAPETGDATAAPTGDPNAGITEVELFGRVNNNGPTGDANTITYEDGVLTMIKDTVYQPFQYVFECPDFVADNTDQDYTLHFKAEVTSNRGLPNPWDSYEFGFLRTNDWGNTGLVAIDSNGYAGADQTLYEACGHDRALGYVSAGEHEYHIVMNKVKGVYSLYVDGSLMAANEPFDLNGAEDYWLSIKNANGDATNTKLVMSEYALYKGNAAPSGSDTPTDPGQDDDDPEKDLIKRYDLNGVYVNGSNGTITKEDGVLHMVKDGEGSNLSAIIWSDAEDTITELVTLKFTATVSGGYGHSYDGYAVSLRTRSGGDTELIRLVPTQTGVDIARGAGGATIAKVDGTGEHTYAVVYCKAEDTLKICVDGKEIVSEQSLGWGDQDPHGFLIKSGHNDATGCELTMTSFELWRGDKGGDGAADEEQTPAPTQEPGATPAPNFDVKGTVKGSATANGKTITSLTPATTVTVKVDTDLTAGGTMNAVLAIVVYDQNGEVKNIAYENVTLSETALKTTLTAGFNLPKDIEGYSIKATVYDSLATMKQIAGEYTIR